MTVGVTVRLVELGLERTRNVRTVITDGVFLYTWKYTKQVFTCTEYVYVDYVKPVCSYSGCCTYSVVIRTCQYELQCYGRLNCVGEMNTFCVQMLRRTYNGTVIKMCIRRIGLECGPMDCYIFPPRLRYSSLDVSRCCSCFDFCSEPWRLSSEWFTGKIKSSSDFLFSPFLLVSFQSQPS